MIRVFFLGQKPIGEKAFELLEERQREGLSIVAVCSNAHTESTWWKSNAIARKIRSGIASYPFVQSDEADEEKLLEIIKETEANTLISVQHPRIITDSVLKMCNYNAFNLHLAKLPDYRGCYGINHALLRMEQEYSVTIHWMTETLDTGNIAFEKSLLIKPDETAISLYRKAERIGIQIFGMLVDSLVSGISIPRIPQSGEGKLYGRNSLNGLREIQNISDKKELGLKARAFYFPPFEPAYFYINRKKYYVTPAFNGYRRR